MDHDLATDRGDRDTLGRRRGREGPAVKIPAILRPRGGFSETTTGYEWVRAPAAENVGSPMTSAGEVVVDENPR
jgi:hypothetical protein